MHSTVYATVQAFSMMPFIVSTSPAWHTGLASAAGVVPSNMVEVVDNGMDCLSISFEFLVTYFLEHGLRS